jgi:hypothetical protein
MPWSLSTEVCRPTFWPSRFARRGAILTGRNGVGRGIIWPLARNHGGGWGGEVRDAAHRCTRSGQQLQ